MKAGDNAIREVFGLKTDVVNNVAYVEDHIVVYPAGHAIVVYDQEERKQKVIPGSDSTDGITAMAICPSKRYADSMKSIYVPQIHRGGRKGR